MGDESTALVPRRYLTKEERRIRRFQHPTPGRRGYPPSTKRKIIDLISFSDHTVEKICAMPGMPDHSTIWAWIRDDAEFAAAYENSKRVRAARLVERVLDDLGEVGRDDIVRAKVLGETSRARFKAAALFDPARYSESMHGALNRLPTGNAVSISISIGESVAETVTIEGKVASKP